MALQDKLLQLFSLDQQVRGIQSRLDAAHARLKVQQTKSSQLNRQCDELRSQLKHNQVKSTSLEKQVAEIDQRIEHLRSQMQSVKNNKEYSAVLVEVNTLKLDKEKIEDDLLEQMGRVEQTAKDLKAMEDQVAQQQKMVDQAESEAKACQAEVGEHLGKLTVQRAAAEQEVPLEARTVFNRTADVHDGETMAPITEESRRNMEYCCGGCFMSLPVERVNALMVSRDQVVICPSCNRILYIDQELKSSISCQ